MSATLGTCNDGDPGQMGLSLPPAAGGEGGFAPSSFQKKIEFPKKNIVLEKRGYLKKNRIT